ncbi:MAG: acyl carrier protein [Deltaproteobacteria bacterium]|nr:acyl carrier protein [Candidatus Deferrimicrobium borealis]
MKAILGTVFDLPADEINDETSPGNVGLWDSLNHLRMVTEIEKVFRIRLAQKEIREMLTYAKIREVVGRHLGLKTDE